MAADSTVNVYIGTWWNYSNNVLTLTLRDKEAGILTAALVIFVGFVATNSWNILKFILHQLRATDDTGDELHRQQQVALRNSANHMHAFLLMTRLAFGWGITKRRVSKRDAFGGSIFLISLTLIASLGWAAAQLFLAVFWTAAGDQFLVVPSNCGWIPRCGNISTPKAQACYDYVKAGLDNANTYQLQCYRGRNESDNSKCSGFPVPHIGWTGSDADCPFGNKDLCIATNSTPFRMDTGYINSIAHLGVNSDPSSAIDYRYRATCSPLVLDYAVSKNGSMFYYYGNNSDIQEDFNTDERATWIHNITGRTDDWHYNVWYVAIMCLAKTAHPILTGIHRAFSFVADKEFRNLRNDWRPNVTMIPEDKPSTLSIFFISAGQMFYARENYDPIFATKVKTGRTINKAQAYAPQNPMSVLGCIEEYELCNPSGSGPNRCMMITRSVENVTVIDRLKLNPSQAATTLILRNELEKGNFRNYLNSLSPQLLATTSLVRGTSNYFQYLDFQKDFWRTEVSRWFDINLIMLQSAFVGYATGPSNPAGIALVATPDDNTNTTSEIRDELRKGCARQIVRNVKGASNFNLRAVLIVIVPGLVIMLLGFTVDSLAGWAQGFFKRGEGKRGMWVQDDMLQPRREGVGLYENVPLETPGAFWGGAGQYTAYNGNGGGQDQMKLPLVAVDSQGGYQSPGYAGGYPTSK